MKRVAQVISLPSEGIEEYERLHEEVWPTVLERIKLSNITNYSIYRYENLLIAYFEYVGNDFEADMAAIAADPETQRWWKLTDPLQRPVPEAAEGQWWHVVPEVFHTD
jgi:L-rhamnose mutarotase